MSDKRTLVVGPTPDYVEYIARRFPGRALFLLSYAIQEEHGVPYLSPPDWFESDLDSVDGCLGAVREHLRCHDQRLAGVTCYDCEWLGLTARLAIELDLSFSTPESVKRSQNKFLAKRIWARNGVRSPKVELIQDGWQTLQLVDRFRSPVILKPVVGSGSELMFKCHDNSDLTSAYRMIQAGLRARNRMGWLGTMERDSQQPPATQLIVAEEYIEGREYSADFIIDHEEITSIRVARKIRLDSHAFGTTLAYSVPTELPGGVPLSELVIHLKKAASALGIVNAICMADFIISLGRVSMIELTPRIGGDCLPALVEMSCGINTIDLALDFAEGKPVEVPSAENWKHLVGMKLLANEAGTLAGVDVSRLEQDPRTLQVQISRNRGHRIVLPPEDHESWRLGHVIFKARPGEHLAEQCSDLSRKFITTMDKHYDRKQSLRIERCGRPTQSAGPSA